jgi:long-chain fatty acid transport protein
MRKLLILVFMTAAVSSVPEDSMAAMGDICGLGIRSQSMAGTGVALSLDGSASYSNPAGLTGIEFFDDVGLTTETGISTFALKAKIDSSKTGIHSPQGQEAVTSIGLSIAADLSSVSKYLGNRPLVFGGTFLVPTDSLYWWRVQLPEEERYISYYDDLNRLTAVAGIAYEPFKWLSIGVSANILLKLDTKISGPAYVDQQAISEIVKAFLGPDGNQEYVMVPGDIAIDQKTKLAFAPIIGIQVKPNEKLSLGFAWRDEIYMDDYGTNHIDVLVRTSPTADPLKISFDYDHHFAHYYSPSHWALGAAYIFDSGLKLSADFTWMQYSGYLDILHQKPEPSFRDVPNLKAGVEKQITDSARWLGDMIIRGGYSFWKSPVPDQTGTTNFLDNDKHIFSIGTENRWDKPGKYWSKPISIQTMAQYHYLVDRTYTKTATGENITLSGYAFTAGISAEFKF